MHEKKIQNCLLLSKFLNRGFTLIELMVSVTVIMILTGGAIAGYIQFNDRRMAFNQAQEVQQWYRIAQQKTTVREVPCADTSTFVGYQVTRSSNTFTRAALCGVTATGSTSYTLSSGVTVPTTGGYSGENPVKFYSLQQGTNITSGVTIKFSKGSTTYYFTINSQGTISDVKKE